MREYDPEEYEQLWNEFKAPLTLDTDLQENVVIMKLLDTMEIALDNLRRDPGSRGYVIWLLKESIRENSQYKVQSND